MSKAEGGMFDRKQHDANFMSVDGHEGAEIDISMDRESLSKLAYRLSCIAKGQMDWAAIRVGPSEAEQIEICFALNQEGA